MRNISPEAGARRSVPWSVRAALVTFPLLFAAAPRTGPGGDGTPVPVQPDPALAVRERIDRWRHSRTGGVQVLDTLLAHRIEVLRASSPTFARGWETLEASGIPVVIGTRAQIVDVLPTPIRESRAWAGIAVSWGDRRGKLERAAVAIRADWLEELHRTYGSEASFIEALDGLLAHEVYGHLVPVIESRNVGRQCSDPGEGERLPDSCVGKRELAIRDERARLAAAPAGIAPLAVMDQVVASAT